ncbi:MAG: sodium:solute symporter family protein [Gemmatimonadaceae bacterium]|jgi:SSS family solute:Na+ symporter|nr:sodium:solute symporter family protein [Gemmatimonadota bacterium]MBK8060435.1 sodium:solute symporter family protein [Gemmatimonadota bacterium]MCC7325076.1 sodium:solute symporter family protein [Gemmatimonadaceae bacterium]
MPVTQLRTLDYVVMAIYFAVVLGIGWALRRKMRTSTDFFLSGRSLPPWVTGLAFLSANLGAQEVIGMGASGAKYGIATAHFYWVGAIPAMVFVGLFMMPFYYGSRARSVPEYLKLRFDEKTRTYNAISFAAMTVFSSGVSMYAMGKLLNLLLGWDFDTSVLVSAGIVLAYVLLGGLTSAIYNEVLQFFMIVFGFAPLVFLGLRATGGWEMLQHRLTQAAINAQITPTSYTHVWKGMGDPATNSIGVEAFGLLMGLGFVLSFGYWCTDFLVVQRAMAADSMTAARRTPLIAAVPKMFFPFLVILPGMIALVLGGGEGATAVGGIGQGLIPAKLGANGAALIDATGRTVLDYDLATPMMLVTLFPTGMLGLGLTALIASFMSGMAGNVTAFNTVWTYDIYQSHIRKGASDEHYLWMGRVATVGGILLSVAAAYAAGAFNNIMEFLQLVFAFVNAPLFATFALGMFWKRSTGHGAFTGLVAGTLGAVVHHGISLARGAIPGIKGGYFATMLTYPSELAQTFWTATAAFTTCLVVTIVVSMITRPRPDEELKGLVYSLTPRPTEGHLTWVQKPSTFAIAVLAMTAVLNVIFF